MKLIIVESPNKVEKIKKIVGKDYQVTASVGHIRDLAKSGENSLGVDWEAVKPIYAIPRKLKPRLDALKKIIKDTSFDEILLATDPDREGEAIAWHLFDALNLKEEGYVRVSFNEITEKAILAALDETRKIDMDLVHSQETRRILDRVVGFRLSRLMQKKTKARSAGRVQSAVLAMIIAREDEIDKFVPVISFTVKATYKSDYELNLIDEKGKIIELDSSETLKKIIDSLGEIYTLLSTESKETKVSKPKPLETSSYLSGAYTKFALTNYRAMQAAQGLYEKGFITYHRTDSIRISSEEFLEEAKKYINTEYKDHFEYIPAIAKKTDGGVYVAPQDAHEAIRITSTKNTPEYIKSDLNQYEQKAYKFIYETTLKSMSIDGANTVHTYIFDNNGNKFNLKITEMKVEGFRVWEDKKDKDKNFLKPLSPSLTKVNIPTKDVEVIKHTTKPPGRYTQSSLITAMKEAGIGRPSTYAPTSNLLINRGYVDYEKGALIPTEIGRIVVEKLGENFKDIVDLAYTKGVEDRLDEISEGKVDFQKELKNFYVNFEKRVQDSLINMVEKYAKPRYTGDKCPESGHPLILRKGPFGDFVGCISYPECKFIVRKPQVESGIDCAECGVGKMLVRKAIRRQAKNANNTTPRIFLGCSNFPKCRNLQKLEEGEEQAKYLVMLEEAEKLHVLEKFDFTGTPYIEPNYHWVAAKKSTESEEVDDEDDDEEVEIETFEDEA